MAEKDEVFDLIRSVIMSQKGGVLLKDLNRDYKSMTGEHIPYIKLGYSCVEDVLDDIPEVRASTNGDGLILYTTKGKNCDHLAELISKQRSTKTKGCSKKMTHKHEKTRNFYGTSSHAHNYPQKSNKQLKYVASESVYQAHKAANEERTKIEEIDYNPSCDEVQRCHDKSDPAEKKCQYETSKVFTVGKKKQGSYQPRLKYAQCHSDAWRNGDPRLYDQNDHIFNMEIDLPRYPNEKGRDHGTYQPHRTYERSETLPHSRQFMHHSRFYRINSSDKDPSDAYNELLHYYDYYNGCLVKNNSGYSYSSGHCDGYEQAINFWPKNLKAPRVNYPQDFWCFEYNESHVERNPFCPSHNNMRSKCRNEGDWVLGSNPGNGGKILSCKLSPPAYLKDSKRGNSQKYSGLSGNVQWKENGGSGFSSRKIDVVSGNLRVTIKNS